MEWGALKGPANATKTDDMEFDAPDEEKIDGIVPELSQRQQDACCGVVTGGSRDSGLGFCVDTWNMEQGPYPVSTGFLKPALFRSMVDLRPVRGVGPEIL